MDWEFQREFTTLINPGHPVPTEITELTGISTMMVRTAPRADEIMPELLNFLKDSPIVGHNVSFDLRFLSAEAPSSRFAVSMHNAARAARLPRP